ncbi:MAG TPA: glycoside hydrolase family 3 N-terminal domain-containing protein [Steroidobacteraceae bacterium]|nr:glycoside hydrolase family 3 N-terminal domain-containing protein [Steroidobacteraceae bacterium]
MSVTWLARDCTVIALCSFGVSLSLAAQTAVLGLPPAAAEAKARDIEAKMTDDERFGLIKNLMVVNFQTKKRDERVPAEIPQMAGWAPGVPRLGVPDLVLTDASLGITNPGNGRRNPDGSPDSSTALPAGLLMGSTFNAALARQVGVALGEEARQRGFNVHLGGGINLMRDVHNGRNFEYFSEDPYVSGVLGAEVVQGTQSTGVMAMLKHLSLYVQETNKFRLDARIDPAAHRESDLLAFQIGIERGNPGSLMCAYNKINGAYACGDDPMLNGDVKNAIGYKGFIMSDWKAVYGWEYALNGLDMQSGAQLDEQEWFDKPLRQAMAEGKFSHARLSDMVRRVLYAVYVSGIDRWKGPQGVPDLAAHRALALDIARQGTVLLKNDGILPLAPAGKKVIAVIGGFGNLGTILGGGGSSLMQPTGGTTLDVQLGGEGPLAGLFNLKLIAPGPVEALKKEWPEAEVIYNAGSFPAQAALLAKRADTVILNGIRFEGEGYDLPDGIPLSHAAVKVLRQLRALNPEGNHVFQWNGKPVDDCNGHAFKKAVERAGLAPLRWHDLRHTFASWALQSGVTLPELKELGSWKSYDMVLKYAHLAPDHLALAADKVGTIRAQRRIGRRARA